MDETDKVQTKEPGRSKSMSQSPDPPSPPSRDLSAAGLEELEKNASHKPASSASSTSSKATSTSDAREVVATSVRETAGKTDPSGEMEVDPTMGQTSEAAETSAVKISRDDRYVLSTVYAAVKAEQVYRCFIITFDSLGGAHNAVYSTLKNYLKSEAKDKKGLEEDKVFVDKENCKGTSAKVPEQPNGCDCGLYVMHFAEIFLRKASQVLACFEKVCTTCRLRQANNDVLHTGAETFANAEGGRLDVGFSRRLEASICITHRHAHNVEGVEDLGRREGS